MQKLLLDGFIVPRSLLIWILVVSLVTGGIAIVYSLTVQGAFVSTGVLLYDGDLSSYRRLVAESFDARRLDAWLTARDRRPDDDVERLRAALASRSGFELHFQPFLTVTRTDIRDPRSLKDEVPDQIDGIAVNFRSPTANGAANLVQLGAQYLRDASLRNRLVQWLQREGKRASSEILLLDEILRTRSFELGLLENDLARLAQVAAGATNRSQETQRHTRSAVGKTDHHPPVFVQQVAVESELIKVRRDLANAERGLAMDRYALGFVSTAFASLAGQETGTGSLAAIAAVSNIGNRDATTLATAPDTVDATERIRLKLDLFRQEYIVRPLLARDTPQVVDDRGRAWRMGFLTAIGTAFFLTAVALMPRVIRWVLALEDKSSN